MPVLADLSAGIVTEPRRCSGLRIERAWGTECVPPRGVEVGWVPEVRRQCAEALYDAARGGWTCLRTGERCGAGYEACASPLVLSTYVEDFALGVRKVPADATGQPLLSAEASGGPVDSSLYLLVAAGVLVVLFLGRKP